MIPSKRMSQTYELKGTYVYLASNASSYMTGAELVIDGAVSTIFNPIFHSCWLTCVVISLHLPRRWYPDHSSVHV